MNVTIKQVAQEANLSVATVSRVLNTKGQVSEKTRRRVLEVAERLRYVPNIAARSLITSQTNTIGVLLPGLHGEFFPEVLRGMKLISRKHSIAELGAQAIERLIHRIHKKNKHRRRHQVLPTASMIRKSFGASLKKTNNFFQNRVRVR